MLMNLACSCQDGYPDYHNRRSYKTGADRGLAAAIDYFAMVGVTTEAAVCAIAKEKAAFYESGARLLNPNAISRAADIWEGAENAALKAARASGDDLPSYVHVQLEITRWV
jgi:hypothetical protein